MGKHIRNGVLYGSSDAGDISYDNTNSEMSATDVQDAIDELASEKQDKTDSAFNTTAKTVVGAVNELKSDLTELAPEVLASVTSDGVKTYGDMLDELGAAVDKTKIDANTRFVMDDGTNVITSYLSAVYQNNIFSFMRAQVSSTGALITYPQIDMTGTGSRYYGINVVTSTITDYTNTATASGTVFKLVAR